MPRVGSKPPVENDDVEAKLYGFADGNVHYEEGTLSKSVTDRPELHKMLIEVCRSYFKKENGKKTCLGPNCTKPPGAALRGLCMKCYSQAKKFVESGRATWQDIVDAGHAEDEAGQFISALKNKKGK